MKNIYAPHQSVIRIIIKAEVMELNEDGQVTGQVVKKIKNVVPNICYTQVGETYEECVKKTKQFIDRMTKGVKYENPTE